MFLESHFGPDAITPIDRPRLAQHSNGIANGESTEETDTVQAEKANAHREAAELARLHELGIPVPGLEIAVDKAVAKVWLETLEVECSARGLGDRVRAVVERAVETVAPLWG